jgi:hypothetical protein
LKPFTILLILLPVFTFSFGQTIPNGRYIGYEQNPFCYQKECSVIHDSITKEITEKWYYQVTLNVTDTLITIEKLPVYFPVNKYSLPYYDSTHGGYYSYKVFIRKGLIGTCLFGYMLTCTYCRKMCAPRYSDAFYVWKQKGENLLMNTENEKNMLFEKQQLSLITSAFFSTGFPVRE